MKQLKFFAAAILAFFAIAALVWAGTVSVQPYGIATPKWFSYSAGVKSTYYLEHPTLTADDQVVVEGVAQTLTNKTLTSPTITNPTISGTITGTGIVSATNITNITRGFTLPLFAAYVDDTGPITASTGPGLAEVDDVPAAVWSSPEVTPLKLSFRVPDDYASDLKILLTTSCSTDPQYYDWQIWANINGIAFDAAAYAQAAGNQTHGASTLNQVLTLTPDATALAGIAAGYLVTIDLWRVNTGAGDFEVKNAAVTYIATQ